MRVLLGRAGADDRRPWLARIAIRPMPGFPTGDLVRKGRLSSITSTNRRRSHGSVDRDIQDRRDDRGVHVGQRGGRSCLRRRRRTAREDWIADPDSNTYGGIKLFRDSPAVDRYLESDIFKSIVDDPSVEAPTYRRYQVIESLTAKTQPEIEVTRAVRT